MTVVAFKGWLAPAALLVAVLTGCGPGAPAVLTPEQVPAAFLALTAKPDRTVHVEWHGTATFAGGAAQAFDASFDLAGADYAGSISNPDDSMGKPGVTMAIELAAVNGQGYERGPGETIWQRLPTLPRTVDPLFGLAAADISYVGQEVRNGQDVHHLRVRNFEPLVSGLSAALFMGTPEGMGETFDEQGSAFDVWTDTAGRPTEAAVEVKPGEVVFAGFSMSATYLFTNWNAEIYIVPPQTSRGEEGFPQP